MNTSIVKKKMTIYCLSGRIIPDKGVIHAIEVAERNHQKLIIAGPIIDEEYFRNILLPRINNNENIQYIGAVAGKQKQVLLKRARCILFPSIWKEPFGLVLIEAMISGTPVLALNNGAALEVLEGFPQLVCNSIDELAHKALYESFPRSHVLREYVLNKFTTSTMVDQYITLYEQKINELKRRRVNFKLLRRRKNLKLVRRRKNLKLARRKRYILKKKILAKRSVTKQIRTTKRSVRKQIRTTKRSVRKQIRTTKRSVTKQIRTTKRSVRKQIRTTKRSVRKQIRTTKRSVRKQKRA